MSLPKRLYRYFHVMPYLKDFLCLAVRDDGQLCLQSWVHGGTWCVEVPIYTLVAYQP